MIVTKFNDIKPIVSENTLHGKWINKMKNNYSYDEIVNKINEDLLKRNYKKENNKYPLGTIAVFNDKNILYYLLAFSEFDDNNRARLSMNSYVEIIIKLLEFYDIYGQGYPIYIPLLGTGRSRLGLSHKDSLNMLKKVLKENLNSFQGEINIVIFDKDMQGINRKDVYEL